MTATQPPNYSSPTSPSLASHDLFRPSWYLRNGHVQTLVGTYVFGRFPHSRKVHPVTRSTGEVVVSDEDLLVYQDDCPADWRPGDRVVLLLHGLAGSHLSPYMVRLANKLLGRNIRSVRLDWRGCGAGMIQAKFPYHSGRSEDLRAAIQALHLRFPDSPISAVGYSMGGNIVLKLLGETGMLPGRTSGLERAVAVCPPIDLPTTVDFLRFGLARWYDAYFTKTCIRTVQDRLRVRPDSVIPEGWFSRPPKTLREFDDTFTAPVCGFESATDYYQKSSSAPLLSKIQVPTLIVSAQDDPVIPYGQFEVAELSDAIRLSAPRHGGHVGFINTFGPDWLDQQIIDWILLDR